LYRTATTSSCNTRTDDHISPPSQRAGPDPFHMSYDHPGAVISHAVRARSDPKAGRVRLDIPSQWPRGAPGPFRRTATTSSCNAHANDHISPPSQRAGPDPFRMSSDHPRAAIPHAVRAHSDPQAGRVRLDIPGQRPRRAIGPFHRTAITNLSNAYANDHMLKPSQTGRV
jgi:hypothetical protein